MNLYVSVCTCGDQRLIRVIFLYYSLWNYFKGNPNLELNYCLEPSNHSVSLNTGIKRTLPQVLLFMWVLQSPTFLTKRTPQFWITFIIILFLIPSYVTIIYMQDAIHSFFSLLSLSHTQFLEQKRYSENNFWSSILRNL